MEQAQSLLDIEPGAIELLDNVLSRLKSSSLPENVFFASAHVDLWKLDATSTVTDTLARVRGALQDLDKIVEVASRISAAAKVHRFAVKSKIMHLGLRSLPPEILQEIVYLSVVMDVALWCHIDICRVLELQSVSRYFRDLVRADPRLWLCARSRNVTLLQTQLERGKGSTLHLYISASDLKCRNFCDIFKLNEHRWRSLHIHVPNSGLCKLARDQIFSSTLCNLQSLAVDYKRFPRAPPEEIGVLDSIAAFAPELTQLRLYNCLPSCKVNINLSIFCLCLGGYMQWSGALLVSFIASQKRLRVLELSVRCEPQASDEGHVETVDAASLVKNRDLRIILRFDTWPSIRALVPIWSQVSSMGVRSLTLDISRMTRGIEDKALSHVLRYSSVIPTLRTLIILNPSPYPLIRYEDVQDDDQELPVYLQTLVLHNYSLNAHRILLPKLARLLCRQESLGVASLQDFVISGHSPPPDTHVSLKDILGEHRISFC